MITANKTQMDSNEDLTRPSLDTPRENRNEDLVAEHKDNSSENKVGIETGQETKHENNPFEPDTTNETIDPFADLDRKYTQKNRNIGRGGICRTQQIDTHEEEKKEEVKEEKDEDLAIFEAQMSARENENLQASQSLVNKSEVTHFINTNANESDVQATKDD